MAGTADRVSFCTTWRRWARTGAALPGLALALAALSVLALLDAAPARAQSVWSATLTVKVAGGTSTIFFQRAAAAAASGYYRSMRLTNNDFVCKFLAYLTAIPMGLDRDSYGI